MSYEDATEGVVAAALAFVSMTSPAWAAAACIQDQDLIALRATALQQQLMVAGYSCHDAAEYNRFVEIYRPQLLSADAALMAFFIHRNPASGSDDYNAFKTKLANVAAIRSANDTGEFCGHAHAAFRAALSTEKASLKDLVAVQSDKAQPVCPSDGGKTLASAVPVPKPALGVPAGIAGAPNSNAPIGALADAQSVTPVLKPVPPDTAQPLTAQKLAELYPNDPPPFSLPTTPADANIPPIAAPTAHVAVDTLAKPAAAMPVQEAQGMAVSGPSLAEAAGPVADAAAPVEDVIAAAPSFAMLAEAPAELAASSVAQKDAVVTAGQAVAANTAVNLAQTPEAVAAAAPADVLSDAEMQAAALSGINNAEANAPADVPAAPRATAPRYAASQYVDPSPNGEDPDLDNALLPPPPNAPPPYAAAPERAHGRQQRSRLRRQQPLSRQRLCRPA